MMPGTISGSVSTRRTASAPGSLKARQRIGHRHAQRQRQQRAAEGHHQAGDQAALEGLDREDLDHPAQGKLCGGKAQRLVTAEAGDEDDDEGPEQEAQRQHQHQQRGAGDAVHRRPLNATPA
jgi:phage repressor protein C with HTH and peptisase S24 domain